MSRKTQNKRKRDTAYHPELHTRDVNSREIFKNDTLASQFLRNYTNIPLFANVRPEDIRDVSSKYRAFLGVEYEADTIKKVYIRDADGTLKKEVYVISLIEHKSDIEFPKGIRGACQLHLQQCAGSDKRNLQEDFMDSTNKDECARG